MAQDNIPRKAPLAKERLLSFVHGSCILLFPKCSSFKFLLPSFITLLALLHLQTTPINFFFKLTSCSSSSPSHHSQPVMFLPLKDLRFAKAPMDGNTWFMSSINDTREKGEAEHLRFPSEASGGRLLCLAGRSASNGTMNSYALAPPAALPRDAKLLSGLTFVSDAYYTYNNLYHGLLAMAPFVAWHETKGCVKPARWVLYQRGELRTMDSVSPWVRALMEVTFGQGMEVERIEKGGGDGWPPTCFEEAVVFRHNQGSMGRERREKVYDMMRCKARAHCNVTRDEAGRDPRAIRVTLLLRSGSRSFKDDGAVARIFERECKKVEGCKLKVALSANLTFCDQVRLMSETDVLASPHGAQVTNMVFMEKKSSVMEFFPKGWLELAGAGQYVFRWVADSAGMRHRGAWNDPREGGERCPEKEASRCWAFYKNGKIGHDEAFFSNWTAEVLDEMRQQKKSELGYSYSTSCQCDSARQPFD